MGMYKAFGTLSFGVEVWFDFEGDPDEPKYTVWDEGERAIMARLEAWFMQPSNTEIQESVCVLKCEVHGLEDEDGEEVYD